MTAILSETFYPLHDDRTYRRQGRHIIVACIESLVPIRAVFDPSIWGGGSSEYTWGRVQKFYARLPEARRGQMPAHFYCEYLEDDYIVYVGCPSTNKSWFLQAAVAAGVLHPVYLDAILIVLQENYGVEITERRLWGVLAHTTITPLMREHDVSRDRVLFFEKIANRAATEGPDWPYRFREPMFLDPLQLDLHLKDYEKR